MVFHGVYVVVFCFVVVVVVVLFCFFFFFFGGGGIFGLYWVALVWSVVSSLFVFPSLPEWFVGGEVCRVCSTHIINVFVLWVTSFFIAHFPVASRLL